MAGWLTRSLAGARKGWQGQGGGHLQPPWPLCTPSLLAQEGERERQTGPQNSGA